uniref:Cytochrome b6/f complex subunit VIII n=1 Tax=Eichhornia crassipes TaxID=44947 RepID=A0A6G7GD09_EICCR|nr:cytochrome b6/f complex subunit VIII [Pontederia crassipes]QIH96431.1 cytochrome b6/f complex subunit VIII [Pontederia crassipes]WOK41368.1 cytochrome subunit N [Pontederia crassipes]WOK41452.1 cytochrome subunit N [Pontederia crassipes]WOK41536.1 cytochrome subunit N [Pontederia crassipes]
MTSWEGRSKKEKDSLVSFFYLFFYFL